MTGCWGDQVRKSQIRLSPDRAKAFRLDDEKMGRGPEEFPSSPEAPLARSALVVEILDQFLDGCSRDKARRTYEFGS